MITLWGISCKSWHFIVEHNHAHVKQFHYRLLDVRLLELRSFINYTINSPRCIPGRLFPHVKGEYRAILQGRFLVCNEVTAVKQVA
jgi:hypothetical protein